MPWRRDESPVESQLQAPSRSKGLRGEILLGVGALATAGAALIPTLSENSNVVYAASDDVSQTKMTLSVSDLEQSVSSANAYLLNAVDRAIERFQNLEQARLEAQDHLDQQSAVEKLGDNLEVNLDASKRAERFDTETWAARDALKAKTGIDLARKDPTGTLEWQFMTHLAHDNDAEPTDYNQVPDGQETVFRVGLDTKAFVAEVAGEDISQISDSAVVPPGGSYEQSEPESRSAGAEGEKQAAAGVQVQHQDTGAAGSVENNGVPTDQEAQSAGEVAGAPDFPDLPDEPEATPTPRGITPIASPTGTPFPTFPSPTPHGEEATPTPRGITPIPSPTGTPPPTFPRPTEHATETNTPPPTATRPKDTPTPTRLKDTPTATREIPTSTNTPTRTKERPTNTPTNTKERPTETNTPTLPATTTNTPSPTPSATPENTATSTATATKTNTPTATNTPESPTPTDTATATPPKKESPIPTDTATPTKTKEVKKPPTPTLARTPKMPEALPPTGYGYEESEGDRSNIALGWLIGALLAAGAAGAIGFGALRLRSQRQRELFRSHEDEDKDDWLSRIISRIRKSKKDKEKKDSGKAAGRRN